MTEEELDPDFSEDERLFHYTSGQGLFGILKTNCIFATHFRFLNDSKEFLAAKESLEIFVNDAFRRRIAALKVMGNLTIKEGTDVPLLCASEAEKLVNAMYRVTFDLSSPFIFSTFSCKPDHKDYQYGGLLHWATYGRNGGYAIQINPHKLHKLLKEEQARFPPFSFRTCNVSYSSGADVPDKLKEYYKTIGDAAQRIFDCILKSEDVPDVGEAHAAFHNVISAIKDSYFEHEQEARVISFRLNEEVENAAVHEVNVMHRNGSPIPYIELLKGILLGADCPIERIIIGPSTDIKRRKDALEILLQSMKLTKIDIEESNVPYLER